MRFTIFIWNFQMKETRSTHKKINIAIDGFSACGKSTLAKALARTLHFAYVDSGAMYRAVTLFFLDNGISTENLVQMKKALTDIEIHFTRIKGDNRIFLNNVDVSEEIRKMRINENVSQVAAVPEVRRQMVALQQKTGKRKGVVMDGRDIGTVVFPEAELKIFLTADVDIRTQRRYDELLAKGEKVDKQAIKKNLDERDYIDSHRHDSPLRKAETAVELDNSYLSPEEQLAWVLKLGNF